MGDLLNGCLITIVSVSFALLFYALGQSGIVTDCEKVGSFYSGEKVYTCTRKLP